MISCLMIPPIVTHYLVLLIASDAMCFDRLEMKSIGGSWGVNI